ncbi:MAG: hypothetical protein QM724_04785 [Flavobacteriales bacterium]
MDPHGIRSPEELRAWLETRGCAAIYLRWSMTPRAGVQLALVLLLIGCGGWQRLPAYPAYFKGEFVPDPRIRQGGFYCVWDSTVDHSTGERSVEYEVSISYFYADGAVFADAVSGLPTMDALAAFHKARTFLDSEHGQRSSKEYGSYWGLYTVRGDTLDHEWFFPINGEHRAVHSLYLIQSDGSLRLLGEGGIHRSWPYPKPKLTFVEAGKVRYFQSTDWVPDPTEFLVRNERFVRQQLRGIKPPPHHPSLP